jgi:hypothetical protein
MRLNDLQRIAAVERPLHLRNDSVRSLADSHLDRARRLLSISLLAIALSCDSGGGGFADNGGMSGTGLSQGAVTSFGSIFVNGVEWNVSGATIEIDGAAASESDLRLGMVVRIEGDFDSNGTAGTALSVSSDDSLEGPIESDPTDTNPDGTEKSFIVLGNTVLMDMQNTAFDDGASFAGLRADDVVEVSGARDNLGRIHASRIEFEGRFPANSQVELQGTVANLVKNPDGSGDFELGTILVHYVAGTSFSDLTRDSLAEGDPVEAKGLLRINGNEIDADEIELEIVGLGDGNADEAEIEGFVSNLVSNASFDVGGTTVDASRATYDPPGFVVTDGARVEVEGRLENGVLIADTVESEDEDANAENVKIDAAVSEVDPVAGELTILGVTVRPDGETRFEDDRDNDPNFGLEDLMEGDWLEIRGIQTGPSSVRALRIDRDSADPDVLLEGPVDALDVNTPSLVILGQPIPLDGGTLYFDELDQLRTEEEFFRNPGDVMLGDEVKVVDDSAIDLEVLMEADEVSIEN